MILEVQNVHTYYGDSYVLQGASLLVPESKLVVLLGPNGVGKTTLIRSITGVTPPRKGRITFRGMDITPLPPEQIARLGVGLVPQGRRIFPSLTVYENLMIGVRAKTHGGWTLERIFELFPQLKARSSHFGDKLSGGEQQMLSIARALMENPDLLLMDEPTEGLAPLLIENVKDILHRFKEKALSVLLVEQNLGLALEVADYVYVMTRGRIVYESNPDEFRGNEEAMHLYLGI